MHSIASRRTRSEESDAAAERIGRSPMKPEVILHSFGYLTQAARDDGRRVLRRHRVRVCDRRACLRRPRFAAPLAQASRRRLCQRVPRRSAARAAPVHLLFSRRIRARRAGDRGGGRSAGAVVGGLSGGDPARRAQRRAARAGRGGDRARLLRPRHLAAHSSAAGAEDFDARRSSTNSFSSSRPRRSSRWSASPNSPASA